MKFVKKIIFVASALFIQSTPSVKAMDIQQYPEIFSNKDIICRIAENIDNPGALITLRNFCLTNSQLLQKYWGDLSVWRSLTYRQEYLYKNFLDHSAFDLPTYRYLSLVENDISVLMGIKFLVEVEENRKEENQRHENYGMKIMHTHEMKIITPLCMSEVLNCLSRIRTFEKRFNNNSPLDASTVFPLDVQYALWVSEGALFMELQKKYQARPSTRKKIKEIDQLALKYINIIFPNHTKNFPLLIPRERSIETLEHYWLTMLTRNFFIQYPPAALIFALTMRRNFRLYLMDYKSKEIVREIDFRELTKETKYNHLYLEDEYSISEKENELRLRVKEAFKIALETVPEAENLYQESLEYDPNPEEIVGLSKPN